MDGWREREVYMNNMKVSLLFNIGLPVPACMVGLSATVETLCIHTAWCSRRQSRLPMEHLTRGSGD